MVDIAVNFTALEKFAADVSDAIENGASGSPVSDAIIGWGELARAFWLVRFDTFSKGGGTWAPLKAATIRAKQQSATKSGRKPRRKGRGKVIQIVRGGVASLQLVAAGTASILVDKGILKGALSVATVAPGALQERIPGGLRVGYGGGAAHPSGRGTIAAIAQFHQEGGAHLPQRAIIVEPPQAVQDDMGRLLSDALDRQWREVVG